MAADRSHEGGQVTARKVPAATIRGMSGWTPGNGDHPLVAVGKQAIGEAVKAGRLRLGWPQRWLALQAGVSQPTISRLETGRLSGIRWQTLTRIVGVLQLGGGFYVPDLMELVQRPAERPRE
jgi:DNA-binding Xre family transcriptional regulator